MDFNGYKKPSVPLSDVIHEFDLEVLNAPEGMEHILVESDDINRPGLQRRAFLSISTRITFRYLVTKKFRIWNAWNQRNGRKFWISCFPTSFRLSSLAAAWNLCRSV